MDGYFSSQWRRHTRVLVLPALTSALMFTAIHVAQAQTQAQPLPPLNGGTSVSIPASQLVFTDAGARGVGDQTKIFNADAYNDSVTGQHGTFARFDGGFVSKLHTHTHDYFAVVIKGEMENYEVGVKPVKLGPGSYFYQQGKKAHTTTCLSKDGCLIFVVQSTIKSVVHQTWRIDWEMILYRTILCQ